MYVLISSTYASDDKDQDTYKDDEPVLPPDLDWLQDLDECVFSFYFLLIIVCLFNEIPFISLWSSEIVSIIQQNLIVTFSASYISTPTGLLGMSEVYFCMYIK